MLYTLFQVKKSHQRKSIPFKVVHPMIPSASSSEEEGAGDTDIVTRSLDLATTSTSPENPFPTQSFDFSSSKIPPWRSSKGSQPSYLSAGSGSKNHGSPRKSGSIVQSLRQAIQNRPTFSTFRGGGNKNEDKMKKSPLNSPTHKTNGMQKEGKSSPLATIGPAKTLAASSPVLAASSPVAVQPVIIKEKTDNPSAVSKVTRTSVTDNSSNRNNHNASDSKKCDSDPTIAIIQKTYEGEMAISEANADVDKIMKYLQHQIDACRRPGSSTDLDLRKSKDGLVSESRQFVTDSKLLVSSATQSTDKLVGNVNQSLHTLAKITQQCTRTMLCIPAPPQAVTLGSRVKDVAMAYKTTVNAAHHAAGKPLSDPNMKLLMRQATSLAAILSALMKTLKMLEAS